MNAWRGTAPSGGSSRGPGRGREEEAGDFRANLNTSFKAIGGEAGGEVVVPGGTYSVAVDEGGVEMAVGIDGLVGDTEVEAREQW